MTNTDNSVDSIFWFRRDLRLHDNTGLFHALSENQSVLPLFIFDKKILDKLDHKDDARVTFIHNTLQEIKSSLRQRHKDLLVVYGDVEQEFETVLQKYGPKRIYTNRDYEPYAIARDKKIKQLAEQYGCQLLDYKDQVMCEPGEVLKSDGKPYTVYTPYSKRMVQDFDANTVFSQYDSEKILENCATIDLEDMIGVATMGFKENTAVRIPKVQYQKSILNSYGETRDLPAKKDGTTRLGLHLRFGTVSIREVAKQAYQIADPTFFKELIWREFFVQLLFYFPHTPQKAFKEKYDNIVWRTGKEADADFTAWTKGQTGYPIVDAGMRELNETGYMHNRVRMIASSFLCKHLLVDWRRGERYFAQRLLDYEMASNVGNWQWASSSGADAAPYFRIFNPYTQQTKFDPDWKYIQKWVPEHNTDQYVSEIVDYKEGRERALKTYKKALQ